MKRTKKSAKKVSPTSQTIDINELPDLLGLVDYSYSNLVRISHSKSDVRLAFGDISPTGELKPKFGAVMSMEVARNLKTAFDKLMSSIEDAQDDS